MKYFEEMGSAILRDWARFHYDPGVLPQVATEHLEMRRPSDSVDYHQILRHFLDADSLPMQPDLAGTFGQPPLAVYWHPRFFIQALFWTTGTTSIHQHGFSGAFAVLAGSSLQSRYEFSAVDRVNEQMLLGDIRLKDVRRLSVGDIEPIRSGKELIHSVFHLDLPSVTLVIRTANEKENQPQYSYRLPYLALDTFHEDPSRIRRTQILDLVHRLKLPDAMDLLRRAIKASDLVGTYHILKGTHGRYTDEYPALVRYAESVHGRRVRAIDAVIEEEIRDIILTSRRQAIHDADHRFFLALLLKLDNREAVLQAITHWYKDSDPQALLLKWAKELSGTETLGVEFDDLNISLFTSMLEGRSTDDILVRLRDIFSQESIEDQREDLLAHCDRLRDSIAFRALLKPQATRTFADLVADERSEG